MKNLCVLTALKVGNMVILEHFNLKGERDCNVIYLTSC